MQAYDGYRAFAWKVRNFPDNIYTFDTSTHLYQFMYACLEDPGIGLLKKFQLLQTTAENMASTDFFDLDEFYGKFLRLPRRSDERYLWNPYEEQLTIEEWNEVHRKDALYRTRIMMFLQSLLRGGTTEGIMMLAEACLGFPCQVLELWRQTTGLGITGYGRLGRAKEFVIIPFASSAGGEIDQADIYACYKMVDLLKPVNTFVTINTTDVLGIYIRLPINHAESSSTFWDLRQFLTPPPMDPLPPPPPTEPPSWIRDGTTVERESRRFAYHRNVFETFGLNDSVVQSETFITDSGYTFQFGKLDASINSSVGSIQIKEFLVSETGARFRVSLPPTGFKMRIDNEVMLVTYRQASTTTNIYTYRVSRAQDGTAAASHSSQSPVFLGYLPLSSYIDPEFQQWGSWQFFELADSPDNYPSGKFSGDQSHYSADGTYMFAWSSQSEYVAWFTRQVEILGGEIVDNQYRLPSGISTNATPLAEANDSLAVGDIDVTTTFFPRGTDAL